jgi:hypothetical protein
MSGARDTVALGFVARLFRSARTRNGQAQTLLTPITGIGPLTGSGPVAGMERPSLPPGRRPRRPPAQPHAMVLEALSQKVLNAWLQNRHQTLYPLTINLRRLEAPQAELLIQVVAVAMTAAGPAQPAAMERISAWLASVGANSEQLEVFACAAMHPPPLTRLDAVREADLAVYAYAMSLVALDQGEAVNRLFLDYLAARLAVPTNMLQSVNRRYRM